MNVKIEIIPNESQIYPTVGDWRFDDWGDLTIKVSDMKNWKYEMLVAIHELVEVCLCKERGIKQSDVDAFDIQFEKEREQGLHLQDEEPGFAPNAPYLKEHTFATLIEKEMAVQLGVDWGIYDKTVMEL